MSDMSGLDNAATIHATHSSQQYLSHNSCYVIQSAVPVPQFTPHHSFGRTFPQFIHHSFGSTFPTIHTSFNQQYLSQGLRWQRTWHPPWCMRWPRNLQSDSGHGRSSGILTMAASQQHCIQYPAHITWTILFASGSGYSTFTTLWTYFWEPTVIKGPLRYANKIIHGTVEKLQLSRAPSASQFRQLPLPTSLDKMVNNDSHLYFNLWSGELPFSICQLCFAPV